MIEGMLIGVALFASGSIFGYEMCRRARAGKPIVGPFKKPKEDAPPIQRTHPGGHRL